MGIPAIAVQIVTWNHADVIDACLDGLAAQTMRAFALIVVDNASTDGTAARVLQHCADLPQLIFVQEETNTGFCRAQNTATSRSSTKWILFLNPDTRLPPDFLAEATRITDEAPDDVAALAPCILRPDGTLDSTGLEMDRFRRAYDRDRGRTVSRRFEAAPDVFGCTGAAALLRRTMLMDVAGREGPLDTSLFAYCDDMDLAWRAALRGWRCVYESQLVLVHERMARNAIRGLEARPTRARDQILVVRNRFLVMAKCERLSTLAVALLWLVPFEMARLAFLAVWAPRVLAAYPEAIRLLPAAIRARRRVHGADRGVRLRALPWRVR